MHINNIEARNATHIPNYYILTHSCVSVLSMNIRACLEIDMDVPAAL